MEDLVGEENADRGLLLAPAFPFQTLTDVVEGRGWSLIFLLGLQRDDQEPCATRRDTDSVSAQPLRPVQLRPILFFY